MRANVPAIAYLCGDHHMCRIVRTSRDQTTTHVVGNLAGFQNALSRASAHVDRPRSLVRRSDAMMRVGKQEKLFPDFGVEKADSAWVSGVSGRDDALGTERGELAVRKLEQRLERFGGKADKLEGGHG